MIVSGYMDGAINSYKTLYKVSCYPKHIIINIYSFTIKGLAV